MKIEVTAYTRVRSGSGASRQLRAWGRVPGIVYGAGRPPQQIELDETALMRHLRLEAFHSSILDLVVDGTREQVLLRECQMHPWKKQVLHVDFQRIDKTRKIRMEVPLHFTRAEIAPGVKSGGGVVQHVMNSIEIQCLPDDLPEFIEVDLSGMQLNDTLHVNDLKLPPGVEAVPRLRQDNPAVVSVQLPKEIVIEEEAAAPVTEIIGEAPAEAEEGAAAEAEAGKETAGEKKEKE
jgi:large subunit ribosomal protein L25